MKKMADFDKESFKKDVINNVKNLFRKTIDEATQEQVFQAVSYAVKDHIIDRWIATQKAYEEKNAKTVYYLSMEFLMGRALGNNMINLTCYEQVKEALSELGFDLNVIEDQEPDAALGNGGLGRLAACFLDSLATLNYPAYGCGIRYRYGMFKQAIENGYQIEKPDNWLKNGNPFEVKRPEYEVEVKFGGYVATECREGKNYFVHKDYQAVRAIPYDLPIIGYGNNVVNTLRIWDAEPVQEFNLNSFDKGEYQNAVEQANLARNIVEVLYPNDNHYSGKELRLKQQYFFVSASVQRAILKFKENNADIHDLPNKVTFQLNDTHPTVTVAELMRILVDEENLEWDDAWDITCRTCAYTNHTIMAEALEKWPIDLFQKLLPRVYQIVDEINRRFVLKIEDMYPGNQDKVRSMAILYDGQVKMAHLAIAGSYSVNGVAKLHTEILKKRELRDFYEMRPEQFNNKTNGITQRRFLLHANPLLADWATKKVGDGWITDLPVLEGLKKYATDKKAQKEFMDIKYKNKVRLAEYIKEHNGIDVDPNSIFDVQVKRLHEYKRQQMNALYVIHKYFEIKEGKKPATPITVFFGAKAAPAYIIAKDIIHLILCLQQIINNDPEVSPYLKVFMVENYNVTMAEKMIPACDISEQISLASKEASGTGNMKFMLNGALTLGTMDGANVEIAELVGNENIFTFGEDSQTVIDRYDRGDYNSRSYYEKDSELKKAVDFIVSDTVKAVGCSENLERLYNELLNKDWFMTFPDFEDYIATREKAYAAYTDRKDWAKKALINISKAGFFSSDRTIEQYNKEIWKLS